MARGAVRGALSWSAGFFHASNADDILFVTSEQTGFGYFRNFGSTRRQGIEMSGNGRACGWLYAGEVDDGACI